MEHVAIVSGVGMKAMLLLYATVSLMMSNGRYHNLQRKSRRAAENGIRNPT